MINQISLNINSFSYCNFSGIIRLVLEITGCGKKSLPLVYFEYLKSCSDLASKDGPMTCLIFILYETKWRNNFMNILYGIKRIAENVLKEIQKISNL